MGQHSEDRYGSTVGGHRAVTAGPIAVEPRANLVFVEAVVAGGGDVQPLSQDTRGLVWLSEKMADQLQEILDTHPNIEWVQLPWAGVDAFSRVLAGLALKPEAERPVITSAKGAYSEPVAEHALTLLLSCMREIPQKARLRRWKEERSGLSLFGRRVVIVGAGGIAHAIIDLLGPFRVSISVVRRDATKPVAGADVTVSSEALIDLLPTADAVILAAASTEQTAHILGGTELRALPRHAVVVNIARGPLIDTEALAQALREGQIAGAGLDVTDPEPLPDGHPLFDLPQCVITSHSADTPEMTAPLLASRVTHNVAAFVKGSELRGVVSPERGY
jgi:phosphoglycerate dehydrogenase-like enzyme